MDYCTPQPSRRHNPVDSICRKLQTIQWRGDREPNSPFQIPKLSSNSYDSPQCGLRHNLEAILKKGTLHRDNREKEKTREMGMPSRAASQHSSVLLTTPSTPTCNRSTPANVTYTITSTLGERRCADGSDLRQVKTWQGYCSTPTGQSKDSPYFTFTRGPQSAQPDSERPSRSPPLSRNFTQSRSTLSYNLNFSSADNTNPAECELPYPALVVKRLSMGDGGPSVASEKGKENMAEISLICEENLLDTIFHACDTQRRGKVYVSHIVDYLRHTTSRSSEDSGLEELCNMLDPEHKDVSIDLDTYHAVMREWIDDCRNNGERPTEDDITQESVKLRDSLCARRSMLFNMTSGSLEAFGGEASRVEFETSELVYCVADLQMSNQKLQEEVKKLKQVVESMEESNQKLAEENEELHNQAKINQQLAQKEKMLKEEVEEMKATLSCTEEGRARASAHSKHVERENQSLIAKIASLQEENFKVTMETDELQRRITELCDINADLQMQIHSFDAVISEKDAVIVEKSRQIDELKAAVEEYSSITELLRVDKNKLERQMQMILPDLAGASLSLSVAYRMNQSSSGSLQTELALAQSPLEAPHGVDYLSSTSFASPLDETLDREVLLMLQGPSPEHMALEFKNLINKLKRDFRKETDSVLTSVRVLLDDHTQTEGDSSLQTVQAELDARRADWVLSLDQLAQYTDSLEKELIKMAGNMRRSRTEILHLSVRVQEQENQKRQLCEELEQLKTPQDSREASCQTPALEEEVGDDLDWDEEFAIQDFLKNELAERNCQVHDGQREERLEETGDKITDRGEEEDAEERWTVVDSGGEGDVRDTSTPLSVVTVEAQSGQGTVGEGRGSAACSESEPEVTCQPLQEDAVVPLSSHSQAVSVTQPEADALPDLPHSENNAGAEACENGQSDSCGPAETLRNSPDLNQTITPVSTPPTAADMVSPNSTSPGSDETISQTESQPTSVDHEGEEKGGKVDSTAGDMSYIKSLSQDQSASRSPAEDSTSLLPVLVEEEETVQDGAAGVPKAEPSTAGTGRLISSKPTTLSDSSSPQSASSVTHTSQSGSGMASTVSGPSHSEELTRTVEAVKEHKVQEDQNVASMATDTETEMLVIPDTFKDKNNLSPSDKEIEAEFQRLALGFKCDMFTLEKRLRLEERSRDLAEENVRKEVSSCQGLLQALSPLCDNDNQSMEIIQRLQKNLDILIQSMTRVSSRSEMLGAIHQESRIGKAVEVMIQHVENLRRLYTKEHAELLELRETLMQNERSFGSQTEKDDFRERKKQSSQYSKTSGRRSSMITISRAGPGNMHFDTSKTQDGSEVESERLTRRSPWNVAGKSTARPPLKRFSSSVPWVDTEEPSLVMKGTACNNTDCQSEEEQKEETVVERRSSLSELGSKLTSLILPLKTPSPSSSPTSTEPGAAQSLSHSLTSSRTAAAVARGGRGLWLWLAMMVLLAGLLALLASLVMQPAVDAAPVGTGDSWMTIQQLLWPYTGLRYNGQPPV
ncbi:inositol 1,4,5-triphosphate receptor associated 2 isoform X1 [Simochromis diagramma]|uniref:inositol 1,4,5-triphosphate receptor associated 2 isoform X1 n=1 Tax=Simochromis diagramma TaxID=43689 RepID=UPI001A7E7B8B|nr:inositol 1,4,5-triphosphate receptor associated 2 isoform X1 [Simochromis diagramma]XP_039891508.1 inositol 1,4,5-triphosphate receptor associated 2 isoform X1 [Simochromis diagramma]XP_039891509.1 inositol 1,4,5-triphosphate receptor associated 2 isoform X1 [Simochromis diagramma]XP_039891510.1 inositol 1,4,5-triphosphate receptor associated 2 isoform X1 [Simochromis diagramma]XP_039891511.1 inositol 1,4,5-triphosphate receptor associated 2 isoform X1 [Simochromis diagramma]